MIVVRSRTLGYCHGVAHTVKMAGECIERGRRAGLPYFSIGELIHNPDVVRRVAEQGMRVIYSPGEAFESDCGPGRVLCARTSGPGLEGGSGCRDSESATDGPGAAFDSPERTSSENFSSQERGICAVALVRAHGIPDALRREFEEAGFELLDATCVNIKKSIMSIKKAAEEGRTVVVIGVENHAETLCLTGVDGVQTRLVSGLGDLDALFASLGADVPVTVLVQTTFREPEYDELCRRMRLYFRDIEFANHLCPDCLHRKSHVQELSAECSAVVVVGGKNSENTRALASYAELAGSEVFRIENASDLDGEVSRALKKHGKVGVCSGTSTPMHVIDEVCSRLEEL